VSRAVIRPDDMLAEAARLGVSIRPGGAPGKLKLTGPAEAVKQLLPLVERHKAELLEILTERQAAPELPKPDPRLIASDYVPANGQELVRMLERVQRGEALGLSAREADALADLLHLRDREGDDRHLCIECQRVRASGVGWRCAALGPIPSEWVVSQLQRCPTFKGVSHD
jgi:hypothetical protein